MDVSQPWVDGEKIPDERIRDIFRPPPSVPSTFYRNSLVIGSRGVGKTTLLRYQKEIHSGIAVHISLATEFASLTQQTGLGPLAFDIPSGLEPFIMGKAISLLALGITGRLIKKGIEPPIDLLLECLPAQFHQPPNIIDEQWLSHTKRGVARASLENFEGLSETHPLSHFISAFGESCQRLRGSLLVLLDRADMVLAPSLIPVLELLDQSSQYIALVAMRPGHAGQTISKIAETVIAGDNYDIVHLGTYPRSSEWIQFVEEAVQAQIGPRFDSIPKEVKTLVINVSRDSLRTSLELFARYLSTPGGGGKNELMDALEDLRENQLMAAQKTLQKYHPDFRKMLNELRSTLVKKHIRINGPLLLSIKQDPADTLFDTYSRLNRFVEVALRSGALCMPTGQRWVPGLRPTEVEISPILTWQKDDLFWTSELASSVSVALKENELFRFSGGTSKPPSIFVAYRMNFEESKAFCQNIEKAIHSHPDLVKFEVTDGRVPAGAQWAEVIRSRIRRAKVVVADVTGMRPDVLFELGFAYGLSKVIIPAVAKLQECPILPSWLGATQLGHYADSTGIMGVLSSISTHLSNPEFSKIPRAPQPIPGLAVLLRVLDWNKHSLDQLNTISVREGLKCEIYKNNTLDESVIRRAASASLLVVSLDGTEEDVLMHFVCGAIAAKPKAGYASTLPRVILILEEPTKSNQKFVADSLRRCQETVRIIKLEQVKEETEKFVKSYTRWATSSPKNKKK